MVVTKRNGNVVDFDKSRIEIAVCKAFKSSEGYVNEDMKAIASTIANEIEALGEDLTVEGIQNLVEEKLMRTNYSRVAREYITYRYKRNTERKRQEKLNEEIDKKINCKNVVNANANVDEYSFGGRKFEAAGMLFKDKALNEYIAENIANAHRENRIYIHDLDNYALGLHNCGFIDFQKLLKNGFVTRNGDVRPPRSISTAMQQMAVIFQAQSQVQYGGCASSHADFDLAPYVVMSFKKHFKDGLEDIEEFDEEKINNIMNNFDIKLSDENIQKVFPKAYKYAKKHTERECKQSAQGLYHNLNTLESRPGSQLPFTSINFGRDTSEEGRLITKSLLEASIDGIGKHHRTSIFPISIFQNKKGVNHAPGDPNYDLKQLAIKSLSTRLYPNISNNDFSENIEDPNNPDTYLCTMGCRTSMSYDRHGFGYSKVGRGNVSPVTINLAKIGIKHGICLGERETADLEGFWKELDELLKLTERALLDRFNLICSQNPKAAPFMYKNKTMRGFKDNSIYEVMKHGSQAVGLIGLAEMLQALFGKNQLDKDAREFGLSVIRHMSDFCKEASDRNDLNFGLYYTPAENCSYTMMTKLQQEFGKIKNVTENSFLTNSIHVPVWEEISIFDKIDIESEFCKYGTSGCITYVEFDANIIHNEKAIEKAINYAMDHNIPYFAINFPVDTCLDCGYAGEIKTDTCPVCGSENVERLARVTGYLSTDVSNFNRGKQDEVSKRFKHSKKTF